jgi:hypothetical protein
MRSMSLIHLVARALLALAFVAGSWDDLVPPVEAAVCAAQDADDDAGDALMPGPAVSEPLLISEVDLSPQVHSSIVIRRIHHVPKPTCAR